jgi:predicted TIM-barrel enzyme
MAIRKFKENPFQVHFRGMTIAQLAAQQAVEVETPTPLGVEELNKAAEKAAEEHAAQARRRFSQAGYAIEAFVVSMANPGLEAPDKGSLAKRVRILRRKAQEKAKAAKKAARRVNPARIEEMILDSVENEADLEVSFLEAFLDGLKS